MGPLSGFWSSAEGTSAALLDMVLMAALADGAFDQTVQDRVGRVLQSAPELSETDWDLVLARAEALGLEAPLFFETRRALGTRLTDPAIRRRGLTLALQAAPVPTSDEAQAVLGGMAEALGVTELELEAMSEGLEPGPTLYRSRLNHPQNAQRATLFTALEAAEDDRERALILFKIEGVRRLVWRLEGGSKLVNFAERLRFEELTFRVDAILEHAMRRRLVRILAPGEALHPQEQPLIRRLAERLPDGASLIVAHFGPPGPADRSFLAGFDPDRLEAFQI